MEGVRSYDFYTRLTVVAPTSLLSKISIFFMFDLLNCDVLKTLCKPCKALTKDIVIRVNKFLVIEFERQKEHVNGELEDNAKDKDTSLTVHTKHQLFYVDILMSCAKS